MQPIDHEAGEAWADNLPDTESARHQTEYLSCIALRKLPAAHQAECRQMDHARDVTRSIALTCPPRPGQDHTLNEKLG
jgi:hypothetical protein